MFVKPKAGLSVPDPDHGDFLPERGRVVPDSQFWFRRVRDGDVLEQVKGERLKVKGKSKSNS